MVGIIFSSSFNWHYMHRYRMYITGKKTQFQIKATLWFQNMVNFKCTIM